jgi:hypothetical protein
MRHLLLFVPAALAFSSPLSTSSVLPRAKPLAAYDPLVVSAVYVSFLNLYSVDCTFV